MSPPLIPVIAERGGSQIKAPRCGSRVCIECGCVCAFTPPRNGRALTRGRKKALKNRVIQPIEILVQFFLTEVSASNQRLAQLFKIRT